MCIIFSTSYRAKYMNRLVFCVLIVITLTGSISIIHGLSASGENSVRTSDDIQYYNITGRIVPPNATMNTCCQGTVPFFDNATGEFIMSDLKDGEYRIAFALPGYDSHLEIIQINGSDVNLGTIRMLKEGTGSASYSFTLGPWIDGDGNGIPGINVSYEMYGNRFWNLTDVNGIAWIEGPVEYIENGTPLTASFQSRELDWNWNEETPPYNAFNSKKVESEGSNRLMIIFIGILLILLVATVLFIRIFSQGNDDNEQ